MTVDKGAISERLNFKAYYEGQLQGFRPAGGDEIRTACPFHADENPSLYVNQVTGKFMCHGCQAHGDVFEFHQRLHGVDFKTALAALAELAGVNGNGTRAQTKREQARAVIENCTVRYDYQDAAGNYVFSVLRFEEPGKVKTFRQWHYDFEAKDWIQNVQGVRLVPYHLPEVIKAEMVYVVEGEKDADNLTALGFVATCNPQGAGKWRDEYGPHFKGKRVVILPDNDEPGRKHAQDVRDKLLPHAAGLRIVELPGLPPKGDASDWIAAGGTAEELLRLVDQVPEERPPVPPFSFASLDLNGLRAGRYIETKPEKIRWTLEGSLPQGSLGLVVSNGGVGKSWLLLQTAISVATDLDCLDGLFEVGERGRVFCVFGEDIDAVVHARTQAIFNTFLVNPREGVYPVSRDRGIAELQDNLFLLPGTGKDLRLIRDEGGNLAPTQTYHDLLALLKGIEGLKLVILDPLSRFFAGSENDSTQATFFCSLLERICSETGATVLISAHTNKAATNPNESSYNALFQGAIRGASGFTNAARWQMNLTGLKPSEVREAGGNPVRYLDFIAGKVVKKNVGRPESRFWIERTEGGVLRRFASALDEGGTDAEVKTRIVDLIAELEREGDRVTKRQFARDYAAELGLSQRKMEAVIDELLAERLLSVDQGKNEKGRLYDYLTAEISQKEDEQFQDDGTARNESDGISGCWDSAHSAQTQRTLYDE